MRHANVITFLFVDFANSERGIGNGCLRQITQEAFKVRFTDKDYWLISRNGFAIIKLHGDLISNDARKARFKADGMMCTIPIVHSAQRVPPYPLSPVILLFAIGKVLKYKDIWTAIISDLCNLDPEAFKIFQPWLSLSADDPIPNDAVFRTLLSDLHTQVCFTEILTHFD